MYEIVFLSKCASPSPTTTPAAPVKLDVIVSKYVLKDDDDDVDELVFVELSLMEQLRESAKEMATINGSSEIAHGALEEPAIRIQR